MPTNRPGYRAENQIPVVDQNIGHADQDLRRHRQRGMAFLEDGRDLRHHVGHQEAHDRDSDAHHDDGVGQRAANLRDELRLTLDIIRESIEDRFQRRGRLTGPNHPDIEIGKNLAMSRKRVGERGALAHALAHLRHHALDLRLARLCAENSERIDQLHPGAEQRAQLARHQRKVGAGHFDPADFREPVAK